MSQYKYPINLELDDLSEEAKKFYSSCLDFWNYGAVNVTAGILLLAREVERRNKDNEPRLDLNFDPGARLVFSQINSLLRIDTIGGVGPKYQVPDVSVVKRYLENKVK
jgi:hypothetical protein